MNYKDLERIGMPALLELTAEENAELSHACLKLARKLRGENPTPNTMDDIKNNLTEEVADVVLCIQCLIDMNLITPNDINEFVKFKDERWTRRLNGTN